VVSGKTALIYDASNGKRIRELAPMPSVTTLVLFSPDGKRLALATETGYVLIQDLSGKSKSVFLFTRMVTVLHKMAFSPDGRRFATANAGRCGTRPPAKSLLPWRLKARTAGAMLHAGATG
jgi:WD40 repeat protein